ncbi:MAG: exodeoxyribonuclease VII large subunit [Chlamydiales bacterium]|nr:exodeoxyribonuclease VII large subunit [Chlamydiales bacterium]
MEEILTVTQLTSAIKKHLEGRFLYVTVQGEISNFKEQSSGHLYFTLKDAEAQISAVLFRGTAQTLTRTPKAGDQVVLKGELSVYAPRGNYQIIARELKYLGVGELLLKLHELKAKLQSKGWFDAKRKKALPKFPKTIGVVTSPTGSVIQDILHVLGRRYSGFQLLLNPVKVQGEGAAQEIARAIEQFNQHKLADVLIVGRGGGSLEDLWAFNEEIVAQAIFNSSIPVISAVGHETDFCIADFVADIRAPTPSAAAEIAIAEKSKELQFLGQMQRRVRETTTLLLRSHKQRLASISRQPAISQPYFLLGKYAQMVDETKESIELALKRTVYEKRLKLSALQRQARVQSPMAQLSSLKQKLSFTAAHLKAINPKNLLTKGYAIVFQEKEDSIILSAKQVKQDETLRILLQDGTIKAKVE